MKRLIILTLALSLLLGGCVYKASKPQNGVRVYTRGENGALECRTVAVADGQSAPDTAIAALNGSADAPGAFTDGVYITSCNILRGRAQLHMSAAYMDLEGIEKTLTDYAMVYTMTGFDEVLSVDIFCGSRIVGHGLTAHGAVLSDSGGEEPVKLFLPDEEGLALRPCTEYVAQRQDTDLAAAAAQLLLSSLQGVPDGTRVISVTVDSGACELDLSEELYAKEPDSPAQARLIISAIVNTLAYLPEVSSVTVRVNGLLMTSYGGYATDWPAGYDGKIIDLSK